VALSDKLGFHRRNSSHDDVLDRRRFGSGSSELKISARRFNAADLELKLADVIGRAGYLNAAADSSLTGVTNGVDSGVASMAASGGESMINFDIGTLFDPSPARRVARTSVVDESPEFNLMKSPSMKKEFRLVRIVNEHRTDLRMFRGDHDHRGGDQAYAGDQAPSYSLAKRSMTTRTMKRKSDSKSSPPTIDSTSAPVVDDDDDDESDVEFVFETQTSDKKINVAVTWPLSRRRRTHSPIKMGPSSTIRNECPNETTIFL